VPLSVVLFLSHTAVAWGKECTGILTPRHPFFRQLLFRASVLGQLLQAHAAQNVWSLGELDIVIAHNLDAIAPGVAEIEKRTADRLDPAALRAARAASLSSTTRPT
jgi:hypothetical protein